MHNIQAKETFTSAKGMGVKGLGRTWTSDKNDPETKGIWKGLCSCKLSNEGK